MRAFHVNRRVLPSCCTACTISNYGCSPLPSMQTRKVETAGQHLAARQRTLQQAGAAAAKASGPGASRAAARALAGAEEGGSAEGSGAESEGEEEEEEAGASSDAE